MQAGAICLYFFIAITSPICCYINIMIKRANVNYCKNLFRKYAIYQLKPWQINPSEWYDPSEENGSVSEWLRRFPRGWWERSFRRPDSNGQSGGNSIPRMPKERKPIPPEYQRRNRYTLL